MCRVLGVSPSGYYAWRGRSGRVRRDEDLRGTIRTIDKASRGTYGVPRVHAELAAGGERVSRERVARLMREASLAGSAGAGALAPRVWIAATERLRTAWNASSGPMHRIGSGWPT